MRRTRYILAYDIREDRRLREVGQIAKDFGYRLQYSVFICDLNPREKYELKLALGRTIDHSCDSIAFVELGDPETRGSESFEFMGAGGRDRLPEGGPLIL